MLVYPQVMPAPRDRWPFLLRPDFIPRVASAYDPQIISRFPSADFIGRTAQAYDPSLRFLLRANPDFVSRTATAYNPTINAVSLYTSTHSLECNSTGDGATFGDLTEWDGINKCTWSFWFYTSATSGNFQLTTKGNPKIGLGSPASNTNIYFTNGTTLQTNDGPIASANTWYHIVVIYDGSIAPGVGSPNRVQFYVNGGIRTKSGTNVGATLAATSTLFTVGGIIPASTTCYFDEFAVWLGVAATGTQAAELYNSGHIWDLATSTLGQPTHFFHFDNNYNDAGSNPNTGSALSSPAFNSSIVAPP